MSLPIDQLLRLADEMEESLRLDIIETWFPRCIDPSGGFHERFDRIWRGQEDKTRLVVCQARMTWVVAVLSESQPSLKDEFAGHAHHGIRYLTENFLNSDGSLVWDIARRQDGARVSDEIHAYGISFAIYAAAAAHRATGDEAALELGTSAFAWLESHLHDEENGGYFECAGPGDKPILEPRDSAHPRDQIGTLYGQKSQNTHLHLLEAFSELALVWPDPALRTRLREVQDILLHRLYHSDGWLHGFAHPDWTPVPGEISHGHDIEAAHLLMDAAQILDGKIDDRTAEVAQSLIGYVVKHGFDKENGGVYSTGNAQNEVTDKAKVWWVQAETMLGLIRGLQLPNGASERNLNALLKTWHWIKTRQIDQDHRGWHAVIGETPPQDRTAMKAEPWKAAYHDGRALLYGARELRRLRTNDRR